MGGEDRIGCERIGHEDLRRHMDALYSRHGVPEAWDDMSEVFLGPEAVKQRKWLSSRNWGFIVVCQGRKLPS